MSPSRSSTAAVIALPLIGDIDPLRAQQILEALLGGVSRHRARVASIDITGIRTLDTYCHRARLSGSAA